MKGPHMLHVHTTKGKGWKPAEKDATSWHQPGLFDIETGERIVANAWHHGRPRRLGLHGQPEQLDQPCGDDSAWR